MLSISIFLCLCLYLCLHLLVSECVGYICQYLWMDLYLCVYVHVCIVCDSGSLLSPQHDSLFLLLFQSVRHSSLISVGLCLEQLPLFLHSYISMFTLVPLQSSYHTARRMWKPSYNMSHNTVSQSPSIAPPPGDGDRDGVEEAEGTRTEQRNLVLEAQHFLLHSCYSRNVVSKVDHSIIFYNVSLDSHICLEARASQSLHHNPAFPPKCLFGSAPNFPISACGVLWPPPLLGSFSIPKPVPTKWPAEQAPQTVSLVWELQLPEGPRMTPSLSSTPTPGFQNTVSITLSRQRITYTPTSGLFLHDF